LTKGSENCTTSFLLNSLKMHGVCSCLVLALKETEKNIERKDHWNELIKRKLNNDMKEAMKAKETLRLSTIRLLKASIKNEEIAKIKELDDDEILQIIQREIKKRKESSDEYRKANREDLAQKEEEEAKILYAYLPEQASDEEIKKVVENIIKEIPKVLKSIWEC
jgi:uncharacterized protein